MAQGEIQVGPIRVLGVSDATVNYPWPLEELFPGVSVSAWADYRARFPDVLPMRPPTAATTSVTFCGHPAGDILVDPPSLSDVKAGRALLFERNKPLSSLSSRGARRERMP